MDRRGRPHQSRRYRESWLRSRVVVDPRHAEKLHAREPGDLIAGCAITGSPAGEGASRTPGMYGDKESDCAVVAMKRPNNGAQWFWRRPWSEGRGLRRSCGSKARPGPRAGAACQLRCRTTRRAGGGEPSRASFSDVGAVCGSSARTDLCGGRSAMAVPTATHSPPLTRTVIVV